MGGRYYITGVQIGMIKAFVELNKLEELGELIEKIEVEQYMGEYTELKEQGIDLA